MELTNKQAEERLNSPNNLANRFASNNVRVISMNKRILNPGESNSRKIEASDATEIAIRTRNPFETQKEIAEDFGVSSQRVSQIANGKDPRVDQKQVAENLNIVKESAVNKLMESFGFMTSDKLANMGIEKLSRFAVNMATVVDKVTPKETKEIGNQINITMYAPEPKKEKDYKVVDV